MGKLSRPEKCASELPQVGADHVVRPSKCLLREYMTAAILTPNLVQVFLG